MGDGDMVMEEDDKKKKMGLRGCFQKISDLGFLTEKMEELGGFEEHGGLGC